MTVVMEDPTQMEHLISCLCARAAQQVQLDPSSYDRVLNLCHCPECRAVSGQICTCYYLLQNDPQVEGLERYQQSDSLSRYFCGTCGSHVFAHSMTDGRFFVASGLMECPPQSEIFQHWAVVDTHDGGLSSFLPGEVADSAVSCWLDPQTSSRNSDVSRSKAKESNHSPAQLLAQCHCRGIQLYITRPDSTSERPWSHWPDIIVPYNSGASAENEEDVKWWLCDNKSKYMAGTCACRTCRLASGFPIQTWAFIPKSNILTRQKSPLAFSVGTMKRYESSPEVYREFCSRCGASVFWHCKKRPLLLDVSVGLLRAESGPRAEEWFHWATRRTSFSEMAVDKGLVEQLEAGLKTWNSR
ncbi:Mss4-like protein [Aspergillus karnatakaensis]|uniref:Mss4-like protein n=1 Tax=Aspergillus karnatakaensis TaxID=1810916 RepID=UPI003CCDDFFD